LIYSIRRALIRCIKYIERPTNAFVSVLIYFMHLINARDMKHMKLINAQQIKSIHDYWNTGGADKSLARPERKQARATEDFDVHISYLLS